MMTIWRCLIQPKIDYCSQLWSPSNQASISVLEDLQRNFTRLIDGMEGLDYVDRLARLKLYSQERRRERYQIIFIWKLSQGLVKGYSMEFSNSERRRRMAVPHRLMASPLQPVVARRQRAAATNSLLDQLQLVF